MANSVDNQMKEEWNDLKATWMKADTDCNKS